MPPVLSIRALRTLIEDAPRCGTLLDRNEEDAAPPVRAVDGADLDLHPGEMVALVGESGCGKTMLALSVGRLLPARAHIAGGSVQMEGRELTRIPEEELRKIRGSRLAYLFQDPYTCLNPVMSIEEQIGEAIQLHRSLSGASARRLGLELLERVRIPDPSRRIRQYPHQFSGGMRQRAMLAMALAGRPAVLMADEPTTALDVTTQAEILDLLKSLQREQGMAVLLITHDLFGVAHRADRIAVMYAGRIVETAPTREFYRSPSHPYAQALLACRPAGTTRGTFKSIPGSVPDLRFTPSGCPFHPRCPEVVPQCRAEEPRLESIGPDHWVSCWRRGNRP